MEKLQANAKVDFKAIKQEKEDKNKKKKVLKEMKDDKSKC